MGFGGGCLILFVDLDCLIAIGCDESESGAVKGHPEYACLTRQRPRLDDGRQALEEVAALPVPHADLACIPPADEDIVLVDGEGVNDIVMSL